MTNAIKSIVKTVDAHLDRLCLALGLVCIWHGLDTPAIMFGIAYLACVIKDGFAKMGVRV